MKLAQILSGILGTVLAVLAIRWLLSPEESANSITSIILNGIKLRWGAFKRVVGNNVLKSPKLVLNKVNFAFTKM